MNIPGQTLIMVDGERKPVAVSDAQRLFIETYPKFGTVAATCDAIGMHPSQVYRWMDNEPEDSPFREAWRLAKEIGCDYILQDMIDATRSQPATMPSQVSRMFLIKAQRPEYRDQLNIRSTSVSVTAHLDLNEMPPEDRRALLQLALDHESITPPSLTTQLPPPTDDGAPAD